MSEFAPQARRVAHRAMASALIVFCAGEATACALTQTPRVTVAPATSTSGSIGARQTVTIQSASGSALRAWIVRGVPGKGAVLLLHGVASDRTSMLTRAQFLHDSGFTVLAPDFQAQGESPGAHITYGARESLDAASALAYLHAIVPDELIGVIGVSMGGAAALLGPGPLKASAFVLESMYPTIRDAVSDRLEAWFWPFGDVGRSLAPTLMGFIGANAGVAEAELQPIERIAQLGAPLMLLAGTIDPYTPLAEAESLYARAAEPKSMWAIEGAGHEDFHAFAPAEYERRVGAFLAHYLRRTTAP
jgi:fermentation-respiration switch protein FrsA (DUF1100 family)